MLATLIAFAAIAQSEAPQPGPLLMRSPTTNGKEVVFSFAGDLWSVPMEGGSAIRLTDSPGKELGPIFSPDGKEIAFTGQYDGSTDVFVMPARGGIPKRLTAHPAADIALGWTPDGKDVLFSSGMYSTYPAPRLCTVPVAGGVPKALPLPSGTEGSFSPDGQKVAYVAGYKWEQAWKRYRGGQAYSIWIARLSDSKWEQIPKKNENNDNPMWVGNSIYYLSDKNGIEGLFKYDTDNGNVKEVVKGEGFDIKSASAGPGVIVYEQLGSLNVYNTQNGEAHKIPVTINADFPEVRSEIKNITRYVNGSSISPTGQRVVVTARGRVFTVPASKGDAHILVDGDGIDRKDPSWSPDGRTVAYITDEHEKQELALLDLSTNKTAFVTFGDPPANYSAPTWSPDSKKIVYTDNRHKVWLLDVATGKSTSVDTGTYNDPTIALAPKWSPDSKWLTWSRDLDSHMNAIFLYSLDTGKVTQVTDGMANAKGPVFSRDGKYLYFYASTNSGQSLSWLDLSSFNQPNVTSSVYAIVLSKDAPNPLQPESDEEPFKADTPTPLPTTPPATPAKPAEDKPKQDKAPPTAGATTIDLDDIQHRIIALPFPEHDYNQLETTAGGNVLAFFSPPRALSTENGGPGTILKFNFGDRQVGTFADGVGGMQASADGSKVLISRGPGLAIMPANGPPPPGGGAVAMSLMAKVNPRAEWSRMFHLVWRNEKLLLYDPNTHGIDVNVMDKRYSPFLSNLSSRDDLNYLFTDMLGEVAIGHMFIGGGDQPQVASLPGGLLGADYAFENGRYRLARIYDGERWNPTLYAPLAQPGINAKVGEYILAIDGADLRDVNDIYETLEGKAGHQVKVKIGPKADGKDSREVTVVPVPSEGGLRDRAWEEDNRRRVLAATGGNIGYVHVPDTAQGGWQEFTRYYYAQNEKKGMIVDERFNTGGLINNFMVDEMAKKMDAVFTPRHGKDWPTPGVAVFGPKVMLVNQFSGSGGDMFPWLFKERKIGPIIGKRTWGGLVAASGFVLPDGGSVRAPDDAFFNPNGTWDVEGWGVSPDMEVEFDPYLWRQGKDAQLEAAIATIQKEMKTYPYPHPKKPPYRDNTKVDIRY